MKHIFILLFCFLASVNLYCQTNNSDSLNNEILTLCENITFDKLTQVDLDTIINIMKRYCLSLLVLSYDEKA